MCFQTKDEKTNFIAELSDWLVNAFNGEWLRTDAPKPLPLGG